MFESIVFGLSGLIVGSFLNVLILRWGKHSLGGRSACMGCEKTLAWYELVPLVSWIVLRGRCHSCERRISLQYPFVEALTGLLFFLVGFAPLPVFARVVAALITAILIAIAVYDLRTTYIPDQWVYSFCFLALLSLFVFPSFAPSEIVNALLAGPLVALPLFALWYISKGAWMGLGDVKFALGIGWLLGLGGGFTALLLSFCIGAFVSVPLLFLSSPLAKRLSASFTPRDWSQNSSLAYTMKSEIAFGPFLVVGTCIVWFSTMYGFVILEHLL